MKKGSRLFKFMIISAIGIGSLHAQDSSISIEQDPKIDKMLALYTQANKEKGYYSIQIFSGSHRNSQKKKEEAQLEFTDWPITIDFDQPNYKVKIGKFNTKLEADRQLIEVRKKFPGALLPTKKTTK